MVKKRSYLSLSIEQIPAHVHTKGAKVTAPAGGWAILLLPFAARRPPGGRMAPKLLAFLGTKILVKFALMCVFNKGSGQISSHGLPVQILGTGSALPKLRVLSESLDKKLGFRKGFLERASGVSSRYFCARETQIDLAVAASNKALEDAGVRADEIDLIISGCAIPYQTLPTTAPLLQSELGIADGAAAAFDVNSTCLSFLGAFETAARLLHAGEYRTALVFSSEIASRALPWAEQPEEAALFGDGAAAVVLASSTAKNWPVRAFLMRTYPSAYQACQIGAGGTRFDFHNDRENFAQNSLFRMNGKELYRTTAKYFTLFVDDLLARAGWQKEDVDVLVPHQASPFALTHIGRQIDFPKNRIIDISRQVGNQIAASIPTALDHARRQGRLPRGSKALFLGTSAGVSFGGMAYEF